MKSKSILQIVLFILLFIVVMEAYLMFMVVYGLVGGQLFAVYTQVYSLLETLDDFLMVAAFGLLLVLMNQNQKKETHADAV